MICIETGPHIVDFVVSRVCGGTDLGEAVGIGTSRDGIILGGTVFYNWNGRNINAHIAADTPGWMNKSYMRYMLSYPFITCGAERLTAFVDQDNYHCQKFITKMGFDLETQMKDACPSGDILIFVMYKDKCRWIK